MRPDRIVVGAEDDQAIHLMRALYAPFQRNHERLIVTDVKSAELTKYAANAMLATRISFMNELANLAEVLGADIEMVRQGIGSDPRIGYHFLYPGCGYGGSCFPKDVKALIQTAADDANITLKVLTAVEEANDAQKHVLSEQDQGAASATTSTGKHFALWGLAFKPNTDDMREAPSRELIADLFAAGATVTAYDPVAMHETQRIFGDDAAPEICREPDGRAGRRRCAGHRHRVEGIPQPGLRRPSRQALKNPVIFDGRNLYDPKLVRSSGIEYFAIGR